ncbi:MAG: HlyD family type I secretion periplasmic adaptor subunit [Gammaproteobacteria bacterium]|nr:HlyD family type I secretion periplasmic adaptor subunit [Gammaproteobacteria bacterium]MYD77996.1 HlyD family type I secretion periplasmic adaptor subunit [Gammaproteobacteria bacterium]MYI88935.1 HlyD family type I secretion periplasmic adaptor subunit [Gammaproteobacteria bacterium]
MSDDLVPKRDLVHAVPGTVPISQPLDRRPIGVARSMTLAYMVVTIFCGGFAAWAVLAPLQSAAIAPGVLGVSGERKTVQHLEGGIIADIEVTEGDIVAAGQILLVLDDTQPRATMARLEGQRRSAAALEARLVAERDGLSAIDWQHWLRAVDADAARATQERIFNARKASFDSEVAILERRIAQLREQAAGYEGQIAAQDRHVALLDDEIGELRLLVEKGHATKPRLRLLEREEAKVIGERAHNRAQVARLEEAAGEARLQIVRIGNARRAEIATELREVEARLADLNERLTAARDILSRTRVVAPVAGTVVGLGVFTRGAVVAPGQKLLDIVPAGDRLVVEARVAPTDIDSVAVGLQAQVRLTAFSLLTTPPLDGYVIRVSADAFADEHNNASWYDARVSLDPDQPALADLALVPGMPAEVIIVTGTSTPLEYLLKPILTSLNRALRED